MIAVAGGLGAALMFAGATLCSSRTARMVGPFSVLTWVMLVGLAITLPWAALSGLPGGLDSEAVGWLALSGGGNVMGLLLAYTALRTGKVGIVAPILSTEGAIAATISVAAGEPLGAAAGVTLGVIVAGIVLASTGRDGGAIRRLDTGLLAIAAALSFGASLYATGRAGAELPIAWAVLPARLLGVAAVALPLTALSRVRLTRPATPLLVAGGICEVVGFASYAVGARHGLAVSAVLSSQFAALAAVAAFVLFRERLARLQLAGVVLIALGVGVLSWLQA